MPRRAFTWLAAGSREAGSCDRKVRPCRTPWCVFSREAIMLSKSLRLSGIHMDFYFVTAFCSSQRSRSFIKPCACRRAAAPGMCRSVRVPSPRKELDGESEDSSK